MSHLDDVMIDIETLGTAPGAAILSIGAVLFGPAGLGDTFYAPVLLQSCTAVGLTIDAATVGWWFTQSEEARAAAFQPDAVPLPDVLLAFSRWFAARGIKRPWCHGATFDVPLLDAAYKACGMTSPWNFWDVRDTRTLYDLAGIKVDRGVGTHHNALDDAAAQARAASTALRILSERTAPPVQPGFLVTTGEVVFHPAPCAASKVELTAAQIAAGAAVLGDDGKPIGRNTAIMVADAMGVVAAPVAAPTVQAPQPVPTEMVRIGAQMANVMFNLAQRQEQRLTARDCEVLNNLRKEWDAARVWVSAPQAPQQTAVEIRANALEEAALACEARGNEIVKKWTTVVGDDENARSIVDDAKARAWDALQCAAAIRALAGQQVALNGIPATHRHDEGAIARCSYCSRYSLDPATLSDRQPVCECGKQHGWCGSFKKPDADSRWSGKAPAHQVAQGEKGGDHG